MWELPCHLWEHPLLYEWSADGQKLYGWLRRHLCRGEADAPPPARAYHARGFLATYATAEMLMSRALPVSRNTITKLVSDMHQRGVVVARRGGRGYIFVLGEWEVRPGQLSPQPLYREVYYLDGLLRLPTGPVPKESVAIP